MPAEGVPPPRVEAALVAHEQARLVPQEPGVDARRVLPNALLRQQRPRLVVREDRGARRRVAPVLHHGRLDDAPQYPELQAQRLSVGAAKRVVRRSVRLIGRTVRLLVGQREDENAVRERLDAHVNRRDLSQLRPALGQFPQARPVRRERRGPRGAGIGGVHHDAPRLAERRAVVFLDRNVLRSPAFPDHGYRRVRRDVGERLMRAEVENPQRGVRRRDPLAERRAGVGAQPTGRRDVGERSALREQLQPQLVEHEIRVGRAAQRLPLPREAAAARRLEMLDADVRRIAHHVGEASAGEPERRPVEGVAPLHAPLDSLARVASLDDGVQPRPAARDRIAVDVVARHSPQRAKRLFAPQRREQPLRRRNEERPVAARRVADRRRRERGRIGRQRAV